METQVSLDTDIMYICTSPAGRIVSRSNLRIFLISGASSPSLLEEEERLMMERVVGEAGLVMSRVEGDAVGEYQAVAGVSIQSSSMADPHTVTGLQSSKNKQRNALDRGQRPAGRNNVTSLRTSHQSLPVTRWRG